MNVCHHNGISIILEHKSSLLKNVYSTVEIVSWDNIYCHWTKNVYQTAIIFYFDFTSCFKVSELAMYVGVPIDYFLR